MNISRKSKVNTKDMLNTVIEELKFTNKRKVDKNGDVCNRLAELELIFKRRASIFIELNYCLDVLNQNISIPMNINNVVGQPIIGVSLDNCVKFIQEDTYSLISTLIIFLGNGEKLSFVVSDKVSSKHEIELIELNYYF
jgi:hypothetical protein